MVAHVDAGSRRCGALVSLWMRNHHQGNEHLHPQVPLRTGEQRRLALALLVALVAMVAEGVGGWVSNSLALLSDAGHMLADAAAIGLSLLALRMAGRLACLGIALNAVGMWITHAGAEGSMNLRSTFLHLAGDLLNSVGVLASAVLIAWTGQLAVDPIVSFLIAATIVQVPGVAAVHDLHVWTITSGLIALSCHIVVTCQGPDCRSHDEILTEAKAVLRDRFAIEHTTIQFESEDYHHEEVVH